VNRIGDLVRVENQEREFGSSDHYYAIRVQFPDGPESTLLLTERELLTAHHRAAKNPEDWPIRKGLLNFLQDLTD